MPQTYFLNGQTDDAKLLNRSKVNPKNIERRDLLQQYDHIQQENKEINQNRHQTEIELVREINNHKFEYVNDEIKQENGNYSEIDERTYKIIKNSFQMRFRVLNMELSVLQTFTRKELIKNECDTLEMMANIKTCIFKIKAAIDADHFESAKIQLFTAEDLSSHMMKKINAVMKKHCGQKTVKKQERKVEVPDYRSIVTVRGTKEDVYNCLVKARAALENGKFDRAERLLLKAERIIPTEQARDLLKQVRKAEEQKLNSELIKNATKDVEQTCTAKKNTEQSQKHEFSLQDVVKKGNTKLKQNNEPKITKHFEDQEDSLEKNKEKTNSQEKNETDSMIKAPPRKKRQVNKSKPITVKTISDENFDVAINMCNTEEELYPTARSKELLKNKCEIIPSSETTRNEPGKEVKNETSNGIKSQDVDESVNQENTFSSNGNLKKLNCYELPIEATKLNKIGALQYIEKAKDAFQNAKSFLETIRYAKAQNNTGVTVKTEVNYNEHVTDHLLNENHIEYNKCIDVAEKVIVDGDIDKADRLLLKASRINPNSTDEIPERLNCVRHIKRDSQFSHKNYNEHVKYNEIVNDHSQNENIKENNACLIELTTKPVAERNLEKVEPPLSKVIRVNPNNDAQKQQTQDVRGSKPSRDEGNISKTVNSCNDLKQEKEAQLFLSLAIEAKNVQSYVAARHYLQRALERQPNLHVKDLENGRQSLSKSEIKSEAKKLLIKVDDFICMGNFDNAEFVLIVSWDMHRSSRTTFYHKKFIRTRMDLYKTQKKSCLDGTNRIDRISENIFKCDELVYSALTNYENKKFEEAEVLLKVASNVYPCVRITKLLAEIEQAKNTLFQKYKRSWM